MARADGQRADRGEQAPPFVGLTGGLGAGKTTALALLRELGAATLSSDEVVHQLLEQPEVVAEIAERFGERVLADGRVDRGRLAETVFADPEARRALEGILWPRVGAEVAAWRARAAAQQPRPRALVVEVPLLFEAGMEDAFDATIAVVADDSVRSERLADRDQRALAERDRRQLPQHEKAARATFTVRNDGTIEQLRAQLSAVLATIAPCEARR